MKKVLLFLLIALFPMIAFADVWKDPETNVDYEYTPGSGEACVKDRSQSSGGGYWYVEGNVIIRSDFSVNGMTYIVTSLGDYAFYECTRMTGVTIPASITTIGKGAFRHCKALASITMSEGVENIKEMAFFGCENLISITLPSTIVNIGDNAFECCSSLKNITIPQNVKYIGEEAFVLSGLTSVIFEDCSVTIGALAFAYCENLTTVKLPDHLQSLSVRAFSGCKKLESLRIPNCTIPPLCFEGCDNLSSVTFYDTGRPYTIEYNAFWLNLKLTSVTFSEGLLEIGESAFDGCENIESIAFPKSLRVIRDGAFNFCNNLRSITFSEGLDSIGSFAFACCGSSFGDQDKKLTEITLPEGLKYIGSAAFNYCSNLIKVSFPESLEYIGEGAFSGCSLNAISIPANVNFIGSTAFGNHSNGIESVSVNEKNQNYDSRDNCSCVIETVTGRLVIGSQKSYIPEGVKIIDEGAFQLCDKIKQIEIPEGVTSIGKYAFYNCERLSSIIIPSSVTHIGESAFMGTDWYSRQRTGFVYQNGWLLGYKGEKRNVAGSYAIEEGTRGIADNTFSGCSSLSSVAIPSSVLCIGVSAFEGCSSMKNVNIPSGVSCIESRIFYGCSSLQSIRIPEGVISIGQSAFDGCSSLQSIRIPEGVISIGQSAFDGCSSLTSITIPGSVTSIGNYAFGGCANLENVTSNILQPFDIQKNVFEYYDGTRTHFTTASLYVPAGTRQYYSEAEGWKYFENIIELEGVSLTLNVVGSDGIDLTDKVIIDWFDEKGNHIGSGRKIDGIADKSKVYYSVQLDEKLGRIYREVEMQAVVVEGESFTCRLEKIGRLMMEGRVSATDIDKSTVMVNVNQKLNGKYEQAYNTKTDEQGVFSIEVYDDETEITISGDGYLDTKIHREGFSGNGNIGTIHLNLISGFSLKANINLKKAVAIGQAEETTEWSAGLNNIEFVLYNETKNSNISDFTIQNGNVIIKTGAEIGDDIRLTAKSKQNVFVDASTLFTIAEGANSFSLELTELGGLDVTCSSSNNSNTIGYLYNSDNVLIAKGNYVGEILSLRHLHNGTYTLVSMGSSALLGNMTSLSNLNEVGLNEGVDYVTTSVVVTDGVLTEATINDVPRMDDTRFYYTSSDTYFNANKESLTSGNYLTLSAHIDFKPEYSDKVDMLNLFIEIPEGCQIVENSVIANRQAVAHTVDGNRLTMTLNKEQWQGQVRFCVIPMYNKSYTITAMATFDIDGQVEQPIGAALFVAKGLSLSVPDQTVNTNITVSGTAKAHSEVRIYDNDVLVGKTWSTADGFWTAACELYKPYNHSFHELYAKITTGNGMELTSETRQLEYDNTKPIPQKVTMTYYNGWYKKNKTVEFNLLEGTTTPSSYPFYDGTDFTFLADFTRNDSTIIKNVNIKVLNSDGTVRTLPAIYDGKLGKWVATTKYSSASRLPVNVLVEYDAITRYTDEDREVALQEQATLLVSSASLIGSFFDTNVEMTTIDEGDDYVLLECNTGQSGAPFYYRIENVDYQVADNMMKVKQFVYTEGGDGVIGTFTEIADNSITVYVVDVLNSMACKMTVYMSAVSTRASAAESNTPTTANTARTPIREFFGSGRFLDDFLGYFGDVVDLLTGIKEYWNVRGDFDNLCNVILNFSDNLDAANKKTFSLAMAKCPDGSYRLSQEEIAKYHKAIQSVQNLESSFRDQYYLCLEQYKTKLRHSIATYIGTLGLGKALGAISKASKFVNSPVNRWFNNTLNKHFSSYVFRTTSANILSSVIGTGIGATVGWGTEKLDEIFSYKDFNSVRDKTLSWSSGEYCKLLQDYTKLQDGMKRAYKTCEKKNDDEESNDTPKDDFGLKGDTYQNDFVGKGSTPQIDPSGYVYEAVLSNRLEGVTTTCYQKVQKEDMYGDITEEAIVWNAADYSQQNPLKTDAAGFYRWDVPQGMWQVKYEKEGYETVYSEWLPVPPPQLDVNVGMTQSTPPTVKQMRGYESGINIEMSKYMRPVTLNTTNVTVTRNGMAVKGSVEIQNLEKEPYGESEFASKMRFVPESAFNTTDEVVVTVHKEVESYCSVNMESNYVQIVKIEPEIKEIVADSVISIPYQNTKDIQIVVLPKTAAVGKTLRMKTSSAIIASLGAEEVVLDDNGSAIVSLTGELPGGAYLTFTVDETDIVAQSKVNVVTENDMVALPVASIRSGESVEAGTLLTLTCDTEGATIYYTLDGSCPCDEAARIKYEAPIVINSDVIVKAIAVKDDMDDSDIATFVYILSTSGIADNLSGIRIWPYITSSLIHIDLNDLQAESITIANLNGVLIYSAENASGQITVDLGKYADGMYIVNVKCNDGRLVRKIIKVG